jgi:signal transduction histidine kinase
MRTSSPRLLIVDDETLQMRALCDTLTMQGYDCKGYNSPTDALPALQSGSFEILLTDLHMPQMSGVELLEAAQKIDPDLVCVVMTGDATIDAAVDAMKKGALDYISKPFKLSVITTVLSRAIAVRRLRAENIQLKEIVAIHDLSRSIAGTLAAQPIMEKIIDAVFNLRDAEAVCVLRFDERQQLLRVAACRGREDLQRLERTIPLNTQVNQWLARTREELGASSGEELHSAIEHPLHAITSGAAVPMFAGGRLIGVLCFETRHSDRAVAAGELKALTILASTAAVALESAELVEEMEQRVRERTAELEAMNQELEAFSHSVSHDLRAPLRAIEGYCQIVLDEYSASLPEEAQRLLGNVRGGSRRMDALIRDLLAFSRVTRSPLMKQDIRMHVLVTEALAELAAAGSGAGGAELRISGALPETSGDPALLRQVWVNLLGNAFKFSRHRTPPRVEVGYSDNSNEDIFFVRDNGAGFDMRYADRLFGVFQRLHSAQEFEGTGVGLSIVRRIVHRHGGRVWAEGARDQGATIYFSLPKPRDDG